MKLLSKFRGFTLIELLIVIAIIGILASIFVPTLSLVRDKAYQARAESELRSIRQALELYAGDHDQYPPDVDRDIPPGLEEYLAPGLWPNAAWSGSVFDWENWAPDELAHNPKEQIYQISIRFCPLGEPDQCRFPNQDWANNFDYHSAVFYCISGPCRSHSNQLPEHPGYCVNCEEPQYPYGIY